METPVDNPTDRNSTNHNFTPDDLTDTYPINDYSYDDYSDNYSDGELFDNELFDDNLLNDNLYGNPAGTLIDNHPFEYNPLVDNQFDSSLAENPDDGITANPLLETPEAHPVDLSLSALILSFFSRLSHSPLLITILSWVSREIALWFLGIGVYYMWDDDRKLAVTCASAMYYIWKNGGQGVRKCQVICLVCNFVALWAVVDAAGLLPRGLALKVPK